MNVQAAMGVALAGSAPPTPTLINATFELWTATPRGTAMEYDQKRSASAHTTSAMDYAHDHVERYVGLRVFWLTEAFEYRNALLAARRLCNADCSDPPTAATGNQGRNGVRSEVAAGDDTGGGRLRCVHVCGTVCDA